MDKASSVLQVTLSQEGHDPFHLGMYGSFSNPRMPAIAVEMLISELRRELLNRVREQTVA